MIAVGIRELKNRLSEYLRLVRAGEVVLVTDHGEVVAELRQPGAEGGRRGLVTLGVPRDPSHRVPKVPQIAPDGTAQRLIDEDRGDG